METITNKTLEKLKYELVRDGIVSYETLEKAEELLKPSRQVTLQKPVKKVRLPWHFLGQEIFLSRFLLLLKKLQAQFFMNH